MQTPHKQNGKTRPRGGGSRKTARAARAAGQVTVGQCTIKREHLRALRDAWARGRLVLFLGAGVSVPYGLSNWNDLVLDMLLNTDASFEQFWPNYRRALGAWMAGCYNFSPTTLARVIKARMEDSYGPLPEPDRRSRFMEEVRAALYRTFQEPSAEPSAMTAVTRMIQESERAKGGRRIPVVLTTNFDDILETKLSRQSVRALPVYDARRRDGDRLPVVHVHGFLPHRGNIPNNELVFTEDEYHRISYSVFHWSLADVVSCFRNYTVLFVGHSLSDPNLRRLLDATNNDTGSAVHFLVRPEYRIAEPDRIGVIARVEQSAREHAAKMDANFFKTPTQLDSAMGEMLKQARDYEDALFADMGVGVLWINGFDDIKPLLEEIWK